MLKINFVVLLVVIFCEVAQGGREPVFDQRIRAYIQLCISSTLRSHLKFCNGLLRPLQQVFVRNISVLLKGLYIIKDKSNILLIANSDADMEKCKAEIDITRDVKVFNANRKVTHQIMGITRVDILNQTISLFFLYMHGLDELQEKYWIKLLKTREFIPVQFIQKTRQIIFQVAVPLSVEAAQSLRAGKTRYTYLAGPTDSKPETFSSGAMMEIRKANDIHVGEDNISFTIDEMFNLGPTRNWLKIRNSKYILGRFENRQILVQTFDEPEAGSIKKLQEADLKHFYITGPLSSEPKSDLSVSWKRIEGAKVVDGIDGHYVLIEFDTDSEYNPTGYWIKCLNSDLIIPGEYNNTTSEVHFLEDKDFISQTEIEKLKHHNLEYCYMTGPVAKRPETFTSGAWSKLFKHPASDSISFELRILKSCNPRPIKLKVIGYDELISGTIFKATAELIIESSALASPLAITALKNADIQHLYTPVQGIVDSQTWKRVVVERVISYREYDHIVFKINSIVECNPHEYLISTADGTSIPGGAQLGIVKFDNAVLEGIMEISNTKEIIDTWVNAINKRQNVSGEGYEYAPFLQAIRPYYYKSGNTQKWQYIFGVRGIKSGSNVGKGLITLSIHFRWVSQILLPTRHVIELDARPIRICCTLDFEARIGRIRLPPASEACNIQQPVATTFGQKRSQSEDTPAPTAKEEGRKRSKLEDVPLSLPMPVGKTPIQPENVQTQNDRFVVKNTQEPEIVQSIGQDKSLSKNIQSQLATAAEHEMSELENTRELLVRVVEQNKPLRITEPISLTDGIGVEKLPKFGLCGVRNICFKKDTTRYVEFSFENTCNI